MRKGPIRMAKKAYFK